jgi:hypothetical protein
VRNEEASVGSKWNFAVGAEALEEAYNFSTAFSSHSGPSLHLRSSGYSAI